MKINQPTNQPTLIRLMVRNTSFSLCMLTFLTLLSCYSPSADKPDSEKFTLFLEIQSHFQIDVGEEGHSHGDIIIFEGLLTDKYENVVGRLTAKHIIGSLPHKNSNPNQVHEDRFRTLICEFDDSSTIVINGYTYYTIGEIMRIINDPRNTAIVGGTGKYLGARGQVTITRIGESFYEYKFEILL